MLARARPFIRRYSCLNDSGKWLDKEERIKGYIGNVTAFAQADGGKLLESLPPRARDLINNVVIGFAGHEADLSKARLEALCVTPQQFLELRASRQVLQDSCNFVNSLNSCNFVTLCCIQHTYSMLFWARGRAQGECCILILFSSMLRFGF